MQSETVKDALLIKAARAEANFIAQDIDVNAQEEWELHGDSYQRQALRHFDSLRVAQLLSIVERLAMVNNEALLDGDFCACDKADDLIIEAKVLLSELREAAK